MCRQWDWFVIGVVPTDEVFAELDATAQKMLIMTAIVALVFILMGRSASKQYHSTD